MSPTTREAQRAELHKTIWKIANDLRGAIDGWDFKSYVLVTLFYRYISENIADYIDAGEHAAGDASFSYAELPDSEAESARGDIVNEKGFFILPSQLFSNVTAGADTDRDLNDTVKAAFAAIEASAVGTESENDIRGLFSDFDPNSAKLGNTVAERNRKMAGLLRAVGGMPLGSMGENKIDLFGDAYEYLMGMYAANAGKSGGEFFTPQEVSELLARITIIGKKRVNKVYDPACGSASLLLQYAKVLGPANVTQGFFGQEINLTTFNLARMNMFLHDINYSKFDIRLGDTLIDPAHMDDEPFEAIVSNPPYSTKWVGDGDPLLITDPRFAPAGVLAPKSKADLAFTMHMLSWLAMNGTAAIVEFPGVLYRSGAEKKIREYLVTNNYVDAIIQLPPDLFFGTTIATCIIVLKKGRSTTDTLFIDASELFERKGTSNVLMPAHRDRILAALTDRVDVEHFCRAVPVGEIVKNGYQLTVSTYVTKKDDREEIDIQVLNKEIEGIVARQAALRTRIDAIVADLEGAPA